MAIKILAVDDNEVNLKVVNATLSHAGYEVITATSGAQALELLEKIKPELVLLDVAMPEMDGYEVCRRLRSLPQSASIPVIMLTAHDSLEEKMKGYEVGADDYVIKPFQPAELVARMKVLLRRATTGQLALPTGSASVTAVFSLRGGVGVSTVATNLAGGYCKIWGKSTVLVDLCFYGGQSALMLNIPLRNTWSDLAKLPVDEIDADLVQKVLLTHSSGLYVLAAPRKVEEGDLITPELVVKTIELLRTRFQYIVIDLPHDLSGTTLAALDQANDILTVFAPELASVRDTAETLDVFTRLEYVPDHIRLISNWIFEKHGLPRKDIETALRKQIQLVIPFASETFVSAINFGIPPVLDPNRGPITEFFEDFSYFMSSEEDREKKPANPTDTWLQIKERQQARQTKK